MSALPLRLRFAAVLISGAVVVASPWAQQLPEPALRAAFLFNFARFTEWPPASLPPTAPVLLCTDDTQVASALRDSLADKTIGDHPVAVRRLSSAAEAPGCHVAYLRRPRTHETPRQMAALAAAHVFTVGDDAAFLRDGGVAYFMVEDRRLRFVIALDGASRAGLQISSRLLALAVVHR